MVDHAHVAATERPACMVLGYRLQLAKMVLDYASDTEINLTWKSITGGYIVFRSYNCVQSFATELLGNLHQHY